MYMQGCRLHEQLDDSCIITDMELPGREPPHTLGRIRKIGETNFASATTPGIHGSRSLVV